MNGFLVERRTDADTSGRAVGVAVGCGVAGGGARAAGGSGSDRRAAGPRGVAVADRGAVALGVRADGAPGVERGAPDDRDGDFRTPDGPQGYGWGYRTLVGEVSDSLHLRRFCRIGLSGRVPDESTIRKLTRRVGSEMVNEITRALIVKACRERHFRPRAVRVDSTVVEADVKHPT